MNRRQTGTAYERRAGEYLKEQGYELIGYNFRCRQGEIDIIARHQAGFNPMSLAEAGIRPGTVRLSIGTEHIDDILADLEQALE